MFISDFIMTILHRVIAQRDYWFVIKKKIHFKHYETIYWFFSKSTFKLRFIQFKLTNEKASLILLNCFQNEHEMLKLIHRMIFSF